MTIITKKSRDKKKWDLEIQKVSHIDIYYYCYLVPYFNHFYNTMKANFIVNFIIDNLNIMFIIQIKVVVCFIKIGFHVLIDQFNFKYLRENMTQIHYTWGFICFDIHFQSI